MDRLGTAVLFSLVAGWPRPVSGIETVPLALGTAVSSLHLIHADPTTGVIGVTGRLIETVTRPDCETLISQIAMELAYETAEGPVIEDKFLNGYIEGGDLLVYDIMSSLAGVPLDTFSGRVVRDDRGITVHPDDGESYPLALQGVSFPMEMIRGVLAAASAERPRRSSSSSTERGTMRRLSESRTSPSDPGPPRSPIRWRRSSRCRAGTASVGGR